MRTADERQRLLSSVRQDIREHRSGSTRATDTLLRERNAIHVMSLAVELEGRGGRGAGRGRGRGGEPTGGGRGGGELEAERSPDKLGGRSD